MKFGKCVLSMLPLVFFSIIGNTNAVYCGASNLERKKSCNGEQYDTIPFNEFLKDNDAFEILDMGYTNLKSLDTTGFLNLLYRDCIKRVMLNNNQLSSIPPKAFTELKGLLELDFSDNNLTYIGKELCHLQNLEVLQFDNNPIKNFSQSAFKCLKNLKVLSMKNCSFLEVPRSFLNGSHLEEVDFSDNYIRNINDIYVPSKTTMIYKTRNSTPAKTSTATTAGTTTMVSGKDAVTSANTTTSTTTTTTSTATTAGTTTMVSEKDAVTSANRTTSTTTTTTSTATTAARNTSIGNTSNTMAHVTPIVTLKTKDSNKTPLGVGQTILIVVAVVAVSSYLAYRYRAQIKNAAISLCNSNRNQTERNNEESDHEQENNLL